MKEGLLAAVKPVNDNIEKANKIQKTNHQEVKIYEEDVEML